jgi:hypothetical protein
MITGRQQRRREEGDRSPVHEEAMLIIVTGADVSVASRLEGLDDRDALAAIGARER